MSLELDISISGNCCGSTSQSTSGTTSIPGKHLIRISGSDFISAKVWNGANSDGVTILPSYSLQIVWNDLQRYLDEGTEWTRTAQGFTILVDGFDAVANPEYKLYIHINK